MEQAEDRDTDRRDRVEAREGGRERAAEARRDVREERHAGFRHWFGVAATKAADAMGSAWAFLAAVAIVVVWAASGPLFGFSDTWQLVINTGTTVATFLMVFLIQNSQNRDAKATQLKLDELIRAIDTARNDIIGAEMEDEEIIEEEKREVATVKENGNGNGTLRPANGGDQSRR